MTKIMLELERKKKEEKKAPAVWFQYTRYINPLSMYVPSSNFFSNFVGLSAPDKIVTNIFDI